jgi:putative transposase
MKCFQEGIIMARIARVVVPGYPHHVTQRGSRRQPTFFHEEDYQRYLQLMAEWCKRHGVAVWAYCLMPNHVHLITVPSTPDGLARAVGQAHRQYALIINQREEWSGHLWQERFSSFVMDEAYLLAAVRYVELNPVRAGLVSRPEDYPWSSARAHLMNKGDALVDVQPMLERVPAWREFLAVEDENVEERMQTHAKTGRPAACEEFVLGLEKMLGRPMRPMKVGRKKG